MDTAQLSAQLEALEQKYQAAQSTIARLQQRVESQEYQLQQQTQQFEQLQQQLADAQAQLAHMPQVDRQLEHFKGEMLQMIEQRFGRRQPALPETGSGLMSQQLENHTRALNELRREVEKLQRFDEQIALARAESTRLNKEVHQVQADVDNLNKQLEERVKPLRFIDEQQRNSARNLAELQAQLPDLHRKIESNLSKIRLIEQQTPQFTKYEAALDGIREEIRRHRERLDFQIAERERQLKNWTDLAQATEKRLKENETLMEKYAEHYQLNKRALASLQDFQERLQREQHRFGELQRLAEERQRAELEKFQADYEQRWKKQSMELEPQFGDFQKNLESLQQRLSDLSKLAQTLEAQMSLVQQIIEEDAQSRALAVSHWQERLEELANGQS